MPRLALSLHDDVFARSSMAGIYSNETKFVVFLHLQNCRQPYNFFVDMTLARADGPDLVYEEDQILIVCSGNKISIEFAPTLSLDDILSSSLISIALMGVRDHAGNTMSGIISWQFSVRNGEKGGGLVCLSAKEDLRPHLCSVLLSDNDWA
jgi:hypothetical protein